MKNKLYFKKGIENVLEGMVMVIISFFAMTIDNLGNSNYDKVAIVLIIVMIVITLLLNKFGRDFNEE